MDTARLITDRARSIDASGIRRVFELGATLTDPINLSIGQPDFGVPEAMREAAKAAIDSSRNGYTMTTGAPDLLNATRAWLRRDLGWSDAAGLTITSGTSGGLLLAFMAMLGPGDECIIPDPYFVMYPQIARLAGGEAVRCDVYPSGDDDPSAFRMTAERVEPLITERTKFVLYNSPSNPCGTVGTTQEGKDLLDLCRRKGVLLISDEIYDEFAFPETLTEATDDGSMQRCPSPARLPGAEEDVLLIRGFGKTYGCTGWRMGYAAGPKPLIEQINKMQQYTFVCAPSPLQAGCVPAFGIDMQPTVRQYAARRDLVVEKLGAVTTLPTPGGAFYAFAEVPQRLGMTATQFIEKAVERRVLVIPGGVFSSRDTHFRLSFAAPEPKLREGLDILADLLAG